MTIQEENRTMEILLVEDNPADVRLTKEALGEAKAPNRLHVVNDGQEALRFLRKEGVHNKAPKPDLILLDLNIPKTPGLEVLKRIKQDPDLLKIPVVVLSSSDEDSDVTASYGFHANSYVTKPVNLEEYLLKLGKLDDFWFTVAKLPSDEATMA